MINLGLLSGIANRNSKDSIATPVAMSESIAGRPVNWFGEKIHEEISL